MHLVRVPILHGSGTMARAMQLIRPAHKLAVLVRGENPRKLSPCHVANATDSNSANALFDNAMHNARDSMWHGDVDCCGCTIARG